MNNEELIKLINSLSDEKVQEIESIDTTSKEDSVLVIGISNKIKRIEFVLTINGGFSYKYLGIKLQNLGK
jgi:hypothetical protein